LRELYNRLGPIIFGHGLPRVPFIQSRFDPKKLAQVLDEELGDSTLGDAPWRTGFAAIAKRVDTASVWILTNCPRDKYWDGDPDEIASQPDPNLREVMPNRDYRLSTIVQASAAAPFYFDMVKMPVYRHEHGVFFDGGMTPHGNPVLQLALTALIPAHGFGWTPEMQGLSGWTALKDKFVGWEEGADKLMIVSVGTGQPRPIEPEWARRPVIFAIWKAIHALTSLTYDSSLLGITIMQWLGDSPQRWRINGQIEGLENARPGRQPLWTFVRYDAPLEDRWLREHLDQHFTAKELAELAELDNPRRVPELYRIGQLAGDALIRPEQFRDVFNPA
jgi:hypothetical protein